MRQNIITPEERNSIMKVTGHGEKIMREQEDRLSDVKNVMNLIDRPSKQSTPCASTNLIDRPSKQSTPCASTDSSMTSFDTNLVRLNEVERRKLLDPLLVWGQSHPDK